MPTLYLIDKYKYIPKDENWKKVDASVVAYANELLAKRITCMIRFVGRKVSRFPIEADRGLLKEYGFELIFINHLYLMNMLNSIFFHKGPKHFEGEYGSYTLVAFSNQRIAKEQIMSLFMLPYKNIIPFSILAHNTFYNKQRLLNHWSHQQTMSLVLGLPPIFLFLITLHNFLHRAVFRDVSVQYGAVPIITK